MRLIDVERMIFKIPAELTERQRLRILNIIGESIEQTPTVEAIPIEWLIEYAEVNEYETDDEQVTIKLGQIVDLIIDDFKEALTYSEEAEDEEGTDEA